MTNRERFKEVFGVDGSIVANVLPKDDISLGSCGYYGCNEECCCSRIYPRCPKWWDDEYDKDEHHPLIGNEDSEKHSCAECSQINCKNHGFMFSGLCRNYLK